MNGSRNNGGNLYNKMMEDQKKQRREALTKFVSVVKELRDRYDVLKKRYATTKEKPNNNDDTTEDRKVVERAAEYLHSNAKIKNVLKPMLEQVGHTNTFGNLIYSSGANVSLNDLLKALAEVNKIL
jgi:hypothetical protein